MDFILPDYSWNEAKKIDCPFDYKLKIMHFANKTTDLVATRIKRTVADMRSYDPGFRGFNESTENAMDADQLEAIRIENVQRSIRRAKQQVEYAVRNAGCDHMLTLTTRENISDRDRFFSIFKEFVRLVRSKDLVQFPAFKKLVTRSEKRAWSYVAVPEFQARGAFHMHVACVGKQDLHLLRACWYMALGVDINAAGDQSPGAINVQYRKKRFGNVSEIYKTMQLVSYMVKYMKKSFEDNEELGINRYTRAHHIPKPIIHRQFVWSSFTHNQGGYTEMLQEIYAIADFMGLRDLVPWNKAGDEDFFVLRGVQA